MYIFSFLLPFLVITCPTVGNLRNGHVKGEARSYGSRKAFVCEHGFYLVGHQERVCQSNGTWSGVVAKCAGKHPYRNI